MPWKSLVFSISLFFVSMLANAQDMTGRDLRDHMLIELSKKVDHSIKDFEGSPFLKQEFITGRVYGPKIKYKDIALRYNIFNDQMEFQQNNTIYALYPEPRITKVLLGDETYVVEKYEIKGKMAYGYLARLDTGKLTLLSKKVVRFTEKQEPKALEGAGKPAKFTRAQDIYYYKIGNGEITKVVSLKSFIESLPDKREEISNYAKSEKLSVKDEADLMKLVKYYNAL